ncbi:MAG TPA: hypothetical protein VJ831_06870 [Jatrophihabitantaceae bacterium]|nr:hypothetical protein [Jatrophihabitantaceae bacterium]
MGVRELGRLVECVHAPVYFAPEPQANYAALGLRGYWRGYFASRAAALGTASADQVTELFGGFASSFVARAIPEVWTITTPEAVLDARIDGAVRALRRTITDDVAAVAQLVTAAVDAADLTDRPLAAAHAAVPRPDEPLALLWHGCTVLREMRGDAHLQALREFGLTWPQPHVLLATVGRVDGSQRDYRGWTEDEWRAAEDALRAAGRYRTDAGIALVEQVETRTDELATASFGFAPDEVERSIRPIAAVAVELIPFPNAMGLPRS